MPRFIDFVRRTKKQSSEKQTSTICEIKTSQHVEYSSSPAKLAKIANIPVAGMQRSNQGTYITTHSSIASPYEESSRRQSSDASINSGSSKTAVEEVSAQGNGQSVWKGAVNGRQYDKREELTEEDEDMWAKMAM